jgi:hypothetical protein
MNTSQILQEIENEIARLQQVAALLRGGDTKPRRGRPPSLILKAPKTRTLSKASRKKIAAAQKLRWQKYHAAQKKKTE